MFRKFNPMFVILLILCTNLITFCSCQGWVIEDEGCRTPDGGIGNCIPANQCKPIVDVLRKYRYSMTDSIRKQLYAYYCSFDTGIKVCCPSGPIHIQDGSVEESQFPPDVSNHPNLNLLPSDCGYLPTETDKISNGQDADLNEFPWMALLSYRTRRGADFKCGGTIINNRYILTAAHCITNLESPLLGVRVGEYNIKTKQDCVTRKNGNRKCSPGHQDLGIEEIIPHPRFNRTTIVNDIGLLRVVRMDLSVENVRPVCLPLGDTRNEEIQFGTVTGWGYTDVIKGTTTSILQKVNVPVVGNAECKEVYKGLTTAQITNKQLCAGGKNKKDSCPGDSGGPLHKASYVVDSARYIQQGIVSFGHSECGLEGFPGVYTRVAYYMDWILDTIRP